MRDRAYDAVPVQFADASNAHTLDPERTRGQIVDMTLEPDGLYVTAELTPRGQRVLSENPYSACSARIVESIQQVRWQVLPCRHSAHAGDDRPAHSRIWAAGSR